MIPSREDNETADDVINRILPEIQTMLYDVESLRKNEIRDIQAGSGIVMSDERQYGIGKITIDTSTNYQVQIDKLEYDISELKQTNKLLVKYIQEHLNK